MTYAIFAIGFLAQAFFSGRILLQWILSERAKKVVSPTIYWVLSIMGSYLLFLYGWLRDDFAIILGQIISYYIYIWNLREKGVWQKVNLLFRVILCITPACAVAYALRDPSSFIETFFRNDDVPLWQVLFGSAGQIIFTLRFIYQWQYSYKRHESLLPLGFWVISLIGSAMIVSYGLFRLDPVLILGQSTGFLAYTRNIFIYRKERKNALKKSEP